MKKPEINEIINDQYINIENTAPAKLTELITIPAIASPLLSRLSETALRYPIMLQINPATAKKKDNTNPTTANELDSFLTGFIGTPQFQHIDAFWLISFPQCVQYIKVAPY